RGLRGGGQVHAPVRQAARLRAGDAVFDARVRCRVRDLLRARVRGHDTFEPLGEEDGELAGPAARVPREAAARHDGGEEVHGGAWVSWPILPVAGRGSREVVLERSRLGGRHVRAPCARELTRSMRRATAHRKTRRARAVARVGPGSVVFRARRGAAGPVNPPRAWASFKAWRGWLAGPEPA